MLFAASAIWVLFGAVELLEWQNKCRVFFCLERGVILHWIINLNISTAAYSSSFHFHVCSMKGNLCFFCYLYESSAVKSRPIAVRIWPLVFLSPTLLLPAAGGSLLSPLLIGSLNFKVLKLLPIKTLPECSWGRSHVTAAAVRRLTSSPCCLANNFKHLWCSEGKNLPLLITVILFKKKNQKSSSQFDQSFF